MRPSALAAPGGCTTLMLPSGPLRTSSPMRSKMCGSLAYCGSNSFWMIDCGTYQDGLTTTVSIDALVSGVGVCGLPATILVRHATRCSLTTFNVKSGTLTIT